MAIDMNVRKSVTLNADIMDNSENRRASIVSLSASISTDSVSNLSQSIIDREKYVANRTEIRKSISEFQQEVWKTEDEAKLIEKLTQFYREESHKLGKEIAEYFARYGKDNVIEYRSLLTRLSGADRKLLYERFDAFIEKYPQYKHLTDVRKSIYKLTRLEGLNESIKLQQLEIGAKEVDRLHGYLMDLYGDTYYKMADSMGFGRTMLSFDKESADLLINKKWTGQKDYSDRIWEDKSKLISYLTNDFKTSIIRGDSFNRVVKQMSERFVNRSRADIKRIVRTEGTRINNEAMMKTFDDSKLYDEYEYVAVIDRKTSDVCKDLDGEIFKLKDREVGINFPPMHVNCRSSFSVVIPDDYVDRYEKLYGDYFGEEVVNSVDKGYTKASGGVSGAITRIDGDEAKAHAELRYVAIRKQKYDVSKIAKRTGFSKEQIREIKNYLFIDVHNLGDRKSQFDPDFAIAQSWDRLTRGHIEKHDLTLIRHEVYERKLIVNGMSQNEAHIRATMKFNYEKESREYYDKLEKRQKRKK